MEPKAINKKAASTLRKWAESPELSSSVEEYLRQCHIDATVAETRRVT